MRPVARAGDRFSVCKDRQDLVKGPGMMDCILHMMTQGSILLCLLQRVDADGAS